MEDLLKKASGPKYILYLTEEQYTSMFGDTCHCKAEDSRLDIGLEPGDVEIRVRSLEAKTSL